MWAASATSSSMIKFSAPAPMKAPRPFRPSSAHSPPPDSRSPPSTSLIHPSTTSTYATPAAVSPKQKEHPPHHDQRPVSNLVPHRQTLPPSVASTLVDRHQPRAAHHLAR